MNFFWTTHLKEAEQKEEFVGFIKNSKPVLDRAIAYLHHKAGSVYPTASDYGTPNWDYLQADRNGYLRALAEVEAFLNVFENKESIKSTWLTKTKQPQPKAEPFFNRLKNNLSKLRQKIW